jgi:hypothetical protein
MCFFSKRIQNIEKGIFEASFLAGELAKKNTAVFFLQYFFLLVRGRDFFLQ